MKESNWKKVGAVLSVIVGAWFLVGVLGPVQTLPDEIRDLKQKQAASDLSIAALKESGARYDERLKSIDEGQKSMDRKLDIILRWIKAPNGAAIHESGTNTAMK